MKKSQLRQIIREEILEKAEHPHDTIHNKLAQMVGLKKTDDGPKNQPKEKASFYLPSLSNPIAQTKITSHSDLDKWFADFRERYNEEPILKRGSQGIEVINPTHVKWKKAGETSASEFYGSGGSYKGD